MKKFRFLGWLLALAGLLSCLAGGVPALAAVTDESVTRGCHSPEAALPLSEEGKLTETAKAVLVYELNSDTFVYGYNPDGRIYPSSMVKLMTALVALENGQLDETVTVTKRALSYVQIGSVSAGLVAGEVLTLEQLLYCMMVASANDAATVIAEYIGGTQDDFLSLMNRKAKELGCQDTNFTNVHGLHDENTYTTARDICRIMTVALKNEVFRAMFHAESYTVPATNKSEERVVWTTNYMMSKETVKKYYDERVTGGKTGATDEAGRCLVATAEGGGMELLTIVMGAEPEYEEDGLSLKSFGSFEETKILLDHVLSKYTYSQVLYDGQAVTQFPVEGGLNSVVVRPAVTASTVLPVGTTGENLTWIYGEAVGSLRAPVEKGQVLSTIQVWYGAKCLAQTELVAMNGVAAGQPETGAGPRLEKTTSPIWKWLLIGLCCVIGLVLLVMGVLLLRRAILRSIRTARRRRRRNDRQRSR